MVGRLIFQTTLYWGLIAAILFGAAGTVVWPAAWVYLVEMLVLTVPVGAWMAIKAPGLLAERLAFPLQRRQKGWDKLFMVVFMAVWFGWLGLMGADAVRWGWSRMPLALQVVGGLCLPVGVYLCWLTFRENPFAAPVVTIQKERDHHVITTGPYRRVRHPLYAGALFWLAGSPLLLGSWAGVAFLAVIVPVLALRAVKEERMLMVELDGYAAYAGRVRWRLIPHIW